MKYIKKFNTLEEQTAYLAEADIDTYLGYVDENDTVYYEDAIPERYDNKYFTIESTSDNNTIYWKKRDSNKQGKTISASTDDGSTWIEYTSTSGNGITIATLNSGDKLLVKGENAAYFESWNPQGIFASTSSFITYGNVMSLVYGDNFSGQTTLTSGNTFNSLFYQCTGLTSAENLVLPATTLAQSCYSGMFNGCTSLTTAPELPATTLADSCYDGMFYGCTSLTTAPVLPATTLAQYCYRYMFYNCTSLTTAPVLPATTLAYGCYMSMFYGCTSLTTVPELPATTLAKRCYNSMFQGCTNLNYIKCLATNISASSCTDSWVSGVSSTGTFVKNAAMTGWSTDTSGIPSGWTVQNA